MPLTSATAKTQALNSLDATAAGTNILAYSLLCVGSPGDPNTGANENANAGSYARQATTWNASAAGSAKTNSTALSFSTLGTIAVTHHNTASVVTYNTGVWGIGSPLGSSVTAATITIASGAVSLSVP